VSPPSARPCSSPRQPVDLGVAATGRVRGIDPSSIIASCISTTNNVICFPTTTNAGVHGPSHCVLWSGCGIDKTPPRTIIYRFLCGQRVCVNDCRRRQKIHPARSTNTRFRPHGRGRKVDRPGLVFFRTRPGSSSHDGRAATIIPVVFSLALGQPPSGWWTTSLACLGSIQPSMDVCMYRNTVRPSDRAAVVVAAVRSVSGAAP
jgi:hypothetical protein